MDNEYAKGMTYEVLIRRAHKCQRGMRNGAEASFMKNLISAENGNRMSFLPKTEKQFEAVKQYIIKAQDKFLSRKLTETEEMTLQRLKLRTQNAQSSDELCDIVTATLDATDRFKE